MDVLIGYERIKGIEVMDVIVRDVGDKYEIILPTIPERGVTSSDLKFIDVENYKDQKYLKEKVDMNLYKINSDGRDYLAARLSKTRRNVIFRYTKAKKGDCVARVKIEKMVVESLYNDEVPEIIEKEDGSLDIAKDMYKYLYNKRVNVLTLTDLYSGENIDRDKIDGQVLRGGLNREFIKEAGDSEIGLAVIVESRNL